MKAILMSLSVVLVSATAFAQGKVQLANDINSPFILDPTYHLDADASLAGMAIPTTGPLPSGISLRVGLYSISGVTYTLQGSTVLNPVGGTDYPAGTIIPTKIVLTGVPSGSVATFQVRVWESRFASYEDAQFSPSYPPAYYFGEGAVFTMIPGGIVYPNTHNGGLTTWRTGPIVVYSPIPEPGITALAAVGVAGLLMVRRRK